MSAVKRIAGLFGKVRAPLSKLSSEAGPKEDELIMAVIQRIEVEGEEHTVISSQSDPEQLWRRLMRRLDWQLKNSGITVEELIRTYPGDVKALLLFKSYEGGKKKKKKSEPAVLRERLLGLGFKSIQPTVWVLPPTSTPPDLETQDSLKLWFRQHLVKGVARSVDYVFPFIASVDLKKVVAERRGIRKMPTARTLFGVLSQEEVVPPSHLYATMRSRGASVREIILRGDVPFLSSAYALEGELRAIHENEAEIERRLRHLTGAPSINLEDLANLGPETVGKAFEGFVGHPKDFAQRMIVEAQYWMRLLGGTVPG